MYIKMCLVLTAKNMKRIQYIVIFSSCHKFEYFTLIAFRSFSFQGLNNEHAKYHEKTSFSHYNEKTSYFCTTSDSNQKTFQFFQCIGKWTDGIQPFYRKFYLLKVPNPLTDLLKVLSVKRSWLNTQGGQRDLMAMPEEKYQRLKHLKKNIPRLRNYADITTLNSLVVFWYILSFCLFVFKGSQKNKSLKWH